MGQPWRAFYPAGLPPVGSYPEIPLWGLLERSARRDPGKTALVAGDLAWSYAELWRRCRRAAGAVAIEPGERVLLVLDNRPEFVAAYYGALLAGGVVSAASPTLSPVELQAQADDAEPAVIIAPRARRDVLPPGPRFLDVEQLDGPERAPVAASGSLAVLQYTSGTTGRAKGAMMSHRNLVANALQNARWFGWGADEVNLALLPLCHTWGMCCCLNSTIAVGGTVVLDPHPDLFDPARVFELLRAHRATVLYGSATMFHRLLAAPCAEPPDSLRHVKAGAMLTQGGLKQRWDAFCPAAPLQQGYGLTEAGPESHDNPPARFKPGTAGVPLQDTDCRIADPEDPRRTLPAGEPGEVLLRGPQVTPGYWRNEPATRAAFAGEWLRTGDLGVMDEEGYLTIVDRLKDLLKFRGWSISPGTVEECLLRHPAVREAVVVGRPDPVDGEIPQAFLVCDGPPPTAAELAAHCAARLARYEVPRAFHFVDEIPKNHVGKPLRRLLRARLAIPAAI